MLQRGIGIAVGALVTLVLLVIMAADPMAGLHHAARHRRRGAILLADRHRLLAGPPRQAASRGPGLGRGAATARPAGQGRLIDSPQDRAAISCGPGDGRRLTDRPRGDLVSSGPGAGSPVGHKERTGRVTAHDDRAYFRPDIEGLRAVAIGIVLLYHAGVPGADGGFIGVDVFFVISGFLITGLLVREWSSSGRIDLLGLLCPALPPTAAGGPADARGHDRRLVPGPLQPALPRRGRRRGGCRAVRLQSPLRGQRHRLPGRRGGALAGAALLVAERRGAVLPLLAARSSSWRCASWPCAGWACSSVSWSLCPSGWPSSGPTWPRRGPSSRCPRGPGSWGSGRSSRWASSACREGRRTC